MKGGVFTPPPSFLVPLTLFLGIHFIVIAIAAVTEAPQARLAAEVVSVFGEWVPLCHTPSWVETSHPLLGGNRRGVPFPASNALHKTYLVSFWSEAAVGLQ